jgi:hypothetical protein
MRYCIDQVPTVNRGDAGGTDECIIRSPPAVRRYMYCSSMVPYTITISIWDLREPGRKRPETQGSGIRRFVCLGNIQTHTHCSPANRKGSQATASRQVGR